MFTSLVYLGSGRNKILGEEKNMGEKKRKEKRRKEKRRKR